MMAGDKKIAQSEPVAAGLGSATASKVADPKKVSTHSRGAEQGAYYPPTSSYDYHYPGYNRGFSQLDDRGYLNASLGSYSGIPQDNSSPLFYMPSYDTYSTGSFLGIDGHQHYLPSSGYPQYSTYSTYGGDASHGSSALWNTQSALASNASLKSNGIHSSRSTNTVNGKAVNVPLDVKQRQRTTSSSVSNSILQTQHLKPQTRLGSGLQSGGYTKGIQQYGNYSSYINQGQDIFSHMYPSNYSVNGSSLWSENDKFKLKEKPYKSGDAESELTRGPRGQSNVNPRNLPVEEKPQPTSKKDQLNLDSFQTQYDHAKFYVIKSYSEDDVHKCVKYDVWSSTPNGNKKLDSAFHEAEEKTSETGKKCPVFLFFSVNASGQFVGVAEMLGPVDYEKTMDFWQLDKWSGFFPVKWHILKDIPNTQLRHIILENNDNRPVTYTRDTQEIGLRQGLEMLNIFKSYATKTCLLDDFSFYENREKMLKARRISAQGLQSEVLTKVDIPKKLMVAERTAEEVLLAANSADPASLINLTRNLSLNSKPSKTPAVASPGDKLSP